jgi:hypothetical protein
MKKEAWALASICALVAWACRDNGSTIIIISTGGTSGVGGASPSEAGAAFDGGAAGDSAGAGRDAGGSDGTTGGTQGAGGSGLSGASGSGSGGVAGSTGGAGTSGGSGSAGTSGSSGSAGTAGAGGGVTLFFDDFNDGDADGWTASPSGDWNVTAGSYGHDLVENTMRVAAAGMPEWSDVVVEAKVLIKAFGGSSTSYGAGVCARIQGPNDHYCAFLRSNGSVAIRKTLAGSGITLGAGVNVTIALDTWYTLKLRVVGSTLSAEFEGTPVNTVITDSSFATGGIGVMTRATSARFDDVLVVPP